LRGKGGKKHSGETRDIDVLGIGFGPSNIALMIAFEELGSKHNIHFVESRSEAAWHPDMLLQGSDIQNNPLRDLVTPRNPCSRYSFTNYLKSEGRLFDYLNLGLSYPFRKDYARYVAWAARFFESRVDYGAYAQAITVDAEAGRWHVDTSVGPFSARSIVLGNGRSRNVPEIFSPVLGARVFHLCDYLGRINALSSSVRRIGILGASQSAVEIQNDLMARFPHLEVHAIHRSFAMRQKDTSPFSDRVYFPEFVDYFYSADDRAKHDLRGQLRSTNYSSADIDVLRKLYTTIYEERLDGRTRFHIHNNTEVEKVVADGDNLKLSLREKFQDVQSELVLDAVVLATGFKDIGAAEGCELYPKILEGVASTLARRSDGALDVERDYSVTSDSGLALYLNGLCESSHGLGDAGSFSLVSLRSLEILNSLEKYLEKSRLREERSIAARLRYADRGVEQYVAR